MLQSGTIFAQSSMSNDTVVINVRAKELTAAACTMLFCDVEVCGPPKHGSSSKFEFERSSLKKSHQRYTRIM